MLKIVETSTAKKTVGLAITYRAGSQDKYGTCPSACVLNCSKKKAKEKVDSDYLDALLKAKPKRGLSFTYSSADPCNYAHRLNEDSTVINYSAPTHDVAVEKFKTMPVAVVYKWKPDQKNARHKGALIVRCPAEYNAVRGCADCGGGVPLCARLNRNYIIGFEPHGAQKKKAADPNIKGGCYAANGHTNLHWTATTLQEQGDETDAERVTRFVRGLPPRAIVRHHIAGDVMQDSALG
jgi:hypothetical protein